MTITIKPTEDGNYTVDGLEVRKDTDGNWIGSPEMNPRQVATFQRHITAVKNHKVKGEATYTL